MRTKENAARIESVKIRKIVQDYWIAFLLAYVVRIPPEMLSSIKEAVEKMLGCGDIKRGHRCYQCVHCESTVAIITRKWDLPERVVLLQFRQSIYRELGE